MKRRGIIRCLAAAVLFGASTPAASVLAGEMSTLVLAGLLYLGAAVAVAPVVLADPPSGSAIRASWRPVAVAVIAGGAIAPVLLVAGLDRIDAASASILLNLELVATVLLAATLFREHLGRRLVLAAGLVTAAGVVLSWHPGATSSIGAVLVAAACLFWGLDNCVTARIDQLRPEHVVAAKGIVAGTANVALGLLLASGPVGSTPGRLVAALAIGAGGYGASITLWVKGARDLGAARGQVIFAAAPFIGALLSWMLLGVPVTSAQILAVALAAVGVALSFGTAHIHTHRHPPMAHDHEHVHGADSHHTHAHEDEVTGRHSHRHTHEEIVHAHPHVPDLHHRHGHG